MCHDVDKAVMKACARNMWNSFKVSDIYLSDTSKNAVMLKTMLSACEYDIAMALAGTSSKEPTTIMKEVEKVLSQMR